jgi:hypothetical protein
MDLSCRFLEFLSLLVSEPGNNKLTQQFLPTIIDLCTTALYPALREVTYARIFTVRIELFLSFCFLLVKNFGWDIRENYFKLVYNVLINNWRYFFKGNVLVTLNGETESTANEQSFIQLMEVNKHFIDCSLLRIHVLSCASITSIDIHRVY